MAEETENPEPASESEQADATTEELVAALTEAQAEAAANRDQFLRAAAELENFRKRAARDVESARKFGLEAFAGELLQVRDSLELGLAATDGQEASVESLREGTGMTLRLLEQVMEKFGIAQIDPTGEPFDPELHEAMVMIESDAAPNSVVEVVQKGYQLNERLLRPARVVVARKADEESRDTA
ncbi:MAG: nucleotide exchange factor GrpE [Gammaproteobacteria bacterium]|nr:nucleotide exchange factor GrpE [Gammaproteobacteria bacterium]NNF61100.1 nucleotide exchange factor GrpE [Gammaproteobacteria bacterium]